MLVHIQRDGQQFGPYTLEDLNAHLASGALLPTDYAWYEGAANWMAMSDVPGVVLPGVALVSPNSPMVPVDSTFSVQSGGAAVEGSNKSNVTIIAIVGLTIAIASLVIAIVAWGTGYWKPGFFVSSSSEDPLPGKGGGGGSEVDYAKFASVQPIFEAHNCFKCHSSNAGKVKAKLDFDMPDTVKRHLLEEDGEINMMVRLKDKDDPMPPEGDGTMLSTDELAKVKAWIDAGGNFD